MQQYDLKNPMYFADFRMDALLESASEGKLQVNEIPRFPAIRRDIAIILSKQVSYADVEKTIVRVGDRLLTDCHLFDIYENTEALGAGKRSLAISLVFQDHARTLTDMEVNASVQKIVSALGKEHDAVLR
jgi:phenylalanyl-tRNA synthetase beta chain